MTGDDWEVVFDGGSPRTRKGILDQLNTRLKHAPGVEYTRFDPSAVAPTEVIASVAPTTFLGQEYPASAATLSVRWSPRPGGKDHFTIQWYERPDTARDGNADAGMDSTFPNGYTLSCGWHQDEHFNELGEAHFQEEYPDGSTERYGETFGDKNPVWILSVCLQAFPERVDAFRDRLEID